MSSRYTLVLDAGMSRAKCFVFDADGAIVSARSRRWEYLESGEAYSLEREWEPEALWLSICRLIRECLASGNVPSTEVGSVAVTSQRQALVFLDAGGREVYAGPNLDLRAFFEGAEIDENHREQVYGITGHLPSFMFAPAKLRWMQRHRPEAYERVDAVLTLGDWLAYRLTGEVANERTLAGEAGLLDIRSGDSCQSLLSELGVELKAGRLIDAGSVVGQVHGPAKRDASLCEGTAVVAAGADTQCGLLGMGVGDAGGVGAVAGWSVPVQMITGEPLFSDDASNWVGCFPLTGRWVAESSAGDLGNAYAWLEALLYGEGSDGFSAMDRLAGSVPAGSEGTQVILGSARTEFRNPGMRAGGFVFPVPLTLTGVGRGNFARAALEAAAYGVRSSVDYLQDLSGGGTRPVALGGGMTRTRSFGRIVANVLGRELRLSPVPDASAMGAWLCAAAACGEFSSLAEGVVWGG